MSSRVYRGYSWKRKIEKLLSEKKSVVAGISDKARSWGMKMLEK